MQIYRQCEIGRFWLVHVFCHFSKHVSKVTQRLISQLNRGFHVTLPPSSDERDSVTALRPFAFALLLKHLSSRPTV